MNIKVGKFRKLKIEVDVIQGVADFVDAFGAFEIKVYMWVGCKMFSSKSACFDILVQPYSGVGTKSCAIKVTVIRKNRLVDSTDARSI